MAKQVKSEKMTKEKQKKSKKTGTLADLRAQANAVRAEVSNLKLENEQRKLKNTTSLTLKRKELARLLTAIREVELTHEENI